MKKILSLSFAAVVVILLSTGLAISQRSTSTTYNTSLGLGIDFGDGGTYAGPSIKHFFTPNNVGKAEILFGNSTTLVSAYYQYHGNIPSAAGLKWTLGLGASGFFGGGSSAFGIRPTAGLDYKITNVPLGLEFDWRPYAGFGKGDGFVGGRFGFGFRYCF